MKSFAYSSSVKTGLNEREDVKRLMEPLAAKIRENPGKYSAHAVGIYLNASVSLLHLSRSTKRHVRTAQRHMRYARDMVSITIRNREPEHIAEGRYHKRFCRRFLNTIILLQRMDTKPWFDIIEKDVQALTSIANA